VKPQAELGGDMKDWITIGQLAIKTGLTARAIRLYEEKGLLKSHSRGDNDYRLYSSQELSQALQIKEFRDMGFSLGEIAEMLTQDPQLTKANMTSFLQKKVECLRQEQQVVGERIGKLESLIASLNTVQKLDEPQRRMIMEELVLQAKEKIKARGVEISSEIEKTLRREITDSLNGSFPQAIRAIDIVRDHAERLNIKLGPGRGSSASSLLLYSKGLTQIFPMGYDLMPELFFHAMKIYVWIDVEYGRGTELLNSVTKEISIPELRAAGVSLFQCPFLQILSDLEKKIGPIDFDAIADDDKRIFENFWRGEVGNIFLFDMPKKSLMYAKTPVEFMNELKKSKENLKDLLKKYKIRNVHDLLNVATLHDPVSDHKKMQLQRYVEASEWVAGFENLQPKIQTILKNSKGLIIYREDLLRILQEYTGWTLPECNRFYLCQKKYIDSFAKLGEYETLVPAEIREWIDENLPHVFMKSHMVAMWWFTKRSALLNSLYPQEYLQALEGWEQKHNSSWSDLGFYDKDHRPLALY